MTGSRYDPYRPPDARVEPSAPAGRRGWLWKAYFWFVFAIYAALTVWLIVDPDGYEAELADYVDTGIYAFVMLGLFGFCYRRRFLARRFWQIGFPVMLAWDAYFNVYMLDWAGLMSGGVVLAVLGVVLVVAIVVPQYVAMYRYGFRERELWGIVGQPA